MPAPFGVEKQRRLVVATTDPSRLPELTTWYLVTNLPAPSSSRAVESELAPADVAEVVRLYSLRSWIEQSYKQVKNSLGWAHYQVRKDIAIRRHWQLVCCAFAFCWWANADVLEGDAPPGVVLDREEPAPTSASAAAAAAGREKRNAEGRRRRLLCWPAALRRVRTWLEPCLMLWRYWKAFSDKPPPEELRALLELLFSSRGLYLYAR